MSDGLYQVKEVARLTRVTVRTLHHYDSVGLLTPSARSRAGYRLYSDDDLLRLQQIMVGRDQGLSLEQIRGMLDAPDFDRKRALLEHRERLVQRVEDTRAMIRSVDAALTAIEGDEPMDAKKIFDGFDPAEHSEEARTRWGNSDAYRESSRRTRGYSPEDWGRIKSEHETVLRQMAQALAAGSAPGDPAVLDLAEQLRLHVDRWYYPCTHAQHAALARMYLADERFKQFYQRFAEGLAEFVAEAIQTNAERHRSA